MNNKISLKSDHVHFKFSEFFIHCNSSEIINAIYDREVLFNITSLVQVLSHLRYLLNDLHRFDSNYVDIPIRITSGYRDYSHNLRVGGVSSSEHLIGSAVDFTCSYLDDAFNILKSNFNFGQLIYYKDKNIIHLSLPSSKHLNNILIK